jgi:hypothetical protein
VRRADHRSAACNLGAERHCPCDPYRFLVKRRDRAADRVYDPTLAIVNQFSWKIGVAEPCGEFGNAFGAVIHRVQRLVAEGEELASNILRLLPLITT